MTLESLRTFSRQTFVSLLPARGHLQNVAWLVFGNLLKLTLGFATSILIFRTLGPNDAGRLTRALGIVGLFAIVGEFGLRDAAVNYMARFLPTAPDTASAIARTFFQFKIFLSLFASTLGIFAAGFIAAQFYPQARVADLIQLGAISLLADGLLGFAIVVLEAQQRFEAISALGILQAVLRAALIAILFLSQNINLYALIALETIVPLAIFIYSLRLIPRSFYVLRFPLLEHFGLLWHFAKWIAVAALASTIFLKLDVLLLSYFRAPAEVGFYAAAFALVGKLDVVKNAILTTAFPDACRRTARDDLRAYVFQSLRFTALTSLAFLPLFAVGGYLIEWLYGADYRAAIQAFYPLLAAFLIGLNAEPVAFVLYPSNRPRWIAAGDVVQLAFSAVVSWTFIAPFGIVGAAWAVLLTRVIAALLTFYLVRQCLWTSHAT